MKNTLSEQNFNVVSGRSALRSILDEKITDTPRTPLPRLVVSDAVSAANVMVAKTRSEIGGLEAFLRSMGSLPAEAK
ncbi:MAG: hypothetical protein HOP17_07830 [Acidobacteria bacterium]|nr:hypothetical protein [Acidobacteriota bacterium]